jgi:hypothetical protein
VNVRRDGVWRYPALVASWGCLPAWWAFLRLRADGEVAVVQHGGARWRDGSRLRRDEPLTLSRAAVYGGGAR